MIQNKKTILIDGIIKQAFPKPRAVVRQKAGKEVFEPKSPGKKKFVGMDGIKKRALLPPRKKNLPQKTQPVFVVPEKKNIRKILTGQKVPVLAAVAALFLAFSFGAWFALTTKNSQADQPAEGRVLAEQTEVPAGSMQLSGIAVPDMGSDAANNSALFNTPLEYLQSYFASAGKPDTIEQRTEAITQFLKDMHSPLVPAADTIARQDHWKLILAIGFAESTLGKNCSDNNCSNIGVGPSSEHWRKYASYSEWVTDFNSLLERKYKDWTLQDMCGVYVQPCNRNWLLATQQILDALKDRGIE